MPASARSFRLTDLYRQRLLALSQRVEAVAKQTWPEDLADNTWAADMARIVGVAQLEGVRLTAGYLAAFSRSEGKGGSVPRVDTKAYVGLSRDGRPLVDALQSPLIGALAARKNGEPDPSRVGLTRAIRTVGFEAMQTPRDALIDTIDADPRFSGFQRSVAGTCGACMELSGEDGPRFEVHPNCECVPEPRVNGVVERFALPTGAELFRAKTPEEQDASLGPEAAQKVRDGEAELGDFVSHSHQPGQKSFLTQRAVAQVT